MIKGKVTDIKVKLKGIFNKTPYLTRFTFNCTECGHPIIIHKPSTLKLVDIRCPDCWEPHLYFVSLYNIDIFTLKEEDIHHWQTPKPLEIDT